MAFVSSGYNPEKPMEGRISDIGPRKYDSFFPPVIAKNFGKWLYHEILEPGVLVHVAESGDKTKAAIASAETAELYGLDILAEGVNADGDNTTRFIVIERSAQPPVMTGEGQRLSLLFTARHKPGQLAVVLDQIGARGFNMECIKSRPLPHVPFEYYFYVQLVCPAGCDAAACNSLLETLTGACSTLRLLGAFTLDGIDQQ